MSGPLDGQVALVAGATRGAGRGIARELAAAGAKVWCTGRSVRSAIATAGRSETIDETADLIVAAGGQAVAVRVDHTVEVEVATLAARIAAEDGRLDILVNDVWGGDAAMDWGKPFWEADMGSVRRLLDQALVSHWLTSRHCVPMMVSANRGLIVEVTDGDEPGYRGHLTYDLIKSGLIRLAYGMAWDLARTGVTALAVSPGFLRSEEMLDRFGVAEANWRNAEDPDFAFSETPHYVGRAIAALAADAEVWRRAGAAWFAADLAEAYGFTDLDGTRPHFWRGVGAKLDTVLASDTPLDAWGQMHASMRYMKHHPDAARSEEMRALSDRLGWRRLGAGLLPTGS